MENGGDIEGVDERRLSDTNFRPVMGIGNLSMSRVSKKKRRERATGFSYGKPWVWEEEFGNEIDLTLGFLDCITKKSILWVCFS